MCPVLCQPATIANKASTLFDGTTRLDRYGQRIFQHSVVAALSEYAVISQNALVKIDPNIPFEVAALFSCTIVTGFGSVVNTAKIGAGQSVAIVGMGEVGLNALLVAVTCDAGQVIAVDVKDKKLQIASLLGALETFNSNLENCVDKNLEFTGGGVNVAFATAGVSPALDLVYKTKRRSGTTLVAGMPGPKATITLSHLFLSADERTIKGSYMGGCVPSRDIPRYIALYEKNSLPIDRLLGDRIGFDDLN
jgi:alcohol dehydrogenase